MHLLAELAGGAGAGADLRAVGDDGRERRARGKVEQGRHGDVEEDQEHSHNLGRLLVIAAAALADLQVDPDRLQDRRRDVEPYQVTARTFVVSIRPGNGGCVNQAIMLISCLHEGWVVFEGDRDPGAVGLVDGALAGSGHDHRRGQSERHRRQAE